MVAIPIDIDAADVLGCGPIVMVIYDCYDGTVNQMVNVDTRKRVV